MAESNMRLNLIMGMVDKLTGPARKATTQQSKMADQVKKTQSELKRLGAMSQDVEHFRKLKREAGQTGDALKTAQGKMAKLANEMTQSQAASKKLTKEYNAAERRVESLAAQMKAAQAPSESLTYEFKQAQAEAKRLAQAAKKAGSEYKGLGRDFTATGNHIRALQNRQESEANTLQEVRGRLDSAGVSTRRLGAANREISAQTTRYNQQLEQQQARLNAVIERQRRLGQITQRNRDMRMNASVDAVGVGVAVFGVKKLVDAYGEVASAQGEIQSLGIASEGIEKITRAAKKFSNEWSGTTTTEFIKASYDIKSGISSLSDEAVAKYTEIAALTATGTKATVGVMTDLFATGYSIYRKQFDQFGASVIKDWATLSDAEKDLNFGEYFSAGISSSVQQFKTDGNKLSMFMSGLGASATQAKQSFAEQLAVGGMLSATFKGGQAATKYQQFLANAGKASEKLGIQVHNANGDLLSTGDILTAISDKYGGTLNDLNKKELKDAFGTKEAVDMIEMLFPKIEELKQKTGVMQDELGKGMETTNKMAEAIGKGAGASFDIAGQRFFNLASAVGKLFSPAMVFVADVLGDTAIKVAAFTEQFPLLSQFIAFAVVGLISLKVASIASRFAFSFFSDGLVVARKVIDFFTLSNMRSNAALMVTRVRTLATTAAMLAMSGATKAMAATTATVTAAQWLFNAALTASPLGLIVMGVMALIGVVALVVKYWEPISAFFAGMWQSVTASFSTAWTFLQSLLSWTPLGVVLEAWEPLTSFFGDMWGKIMGLFGGASAWLTDKVLAPITAIKDAIGGAWDSLFGDSEATVSVSKKVQQVTESVPQSVRRVPVAASPSGTRPAPLVSSPLMASPGGVVQSNSYQFGDINVTAAEGMSVEDVGREVQRQLEAWTRRDAQKSRGRLID